MFYKISTCFGSTMKPCKQTHFFYRYVLQNIYMFRLYDEALQTTARVGEYYTAVTVSKNVTGTSNLTLVF